MLFNSYSFILLYLPIVLFLFFQIARNSHRLAALWLAVASLFFYGWWNPNFVLLLLASITFNYSAGYAIGHARHKELPARPILVAAITIDLVLLGIFKYANFFIDNLNSLGAGLTLVDIVLPLGISFFTFTQIAFLVDVYKGIAREYNFVHYLLFVTWFPHLIAGPVLHHKQMMPQFALPETFRPNGESLAVGSTIFTIGLFKKVMLADQFAVYSNAVFDSAASGITLTFFDAWAGVLAYALQLYFDFSGYSDMAIGLSRMFNIRLPLNFASPYKAKNIIEFWQRWHMTLSRFLRDYLYIPLGGNRYGSFKRYRNLMTTMVLGGLWHGASWNFVLWGGLHGIYLVINHHWRQLIGGTATAWFGNGTLTVLLTFVAVIIAWVPFRALDVNTTIAVWSSMAGMHGISVPASLSEIFPWAVDFGVHLNGYVPAISDSRNMATWLLLGLFIVWRQPNTQQWLSRYKPAWDESEPGETNLWRPTKRYAIGLGLVFGITLLNMNRISQFLYFQF